MDGAEFPIILEHVFEKVWCIQMIWATALTGTAANTVFNPVHFFLALFGDMRTIRGTA